MFVFHCDSSATVCVCVCVDDGLVTSFTRRWFTQLLAPPTRCSLWKLLFSRWPDICSSASHICLLTEWPPTKYRHTSLCLWFEELRRSLEAETRSVHLSLCFVVVVFSRPPPPPALTPHTQWCVVSVSDCQLRRIAVPEIYIYSFHSSQWDFIA